MSSAAAALGCPGWTDDLDLGREQPSGVVVLLIDGLGWRQLEAAAEAAPRLRSGIERVLLAGFPSTTPVGLACLGTGLPTGEHGLVGASFLLPEEDRLLHPLGWGDDPHPVATQPQPTVLERAERAGLRVRSIGPRAFAQSGLTRAALRGGEYRGADSVGELIAGIADDARDALTYAYWGDLDKTGHVHGVDSSAWREELRHVDAFVDRLSARLSRGTLLVITADHGMVDCQDQDRVDLDRQPGLWDGVALLAGEPRMRHVYARRRAAESVLAAWRQTLDGRADVLGRAEAIDAGLFGDVDPEYRGRIGDVIAIARDRTALVSRDTDPVVSSLRGQHGATTGDEVEIPLIRLAGEA